MRLIASSAMAEPSLSRMSTHLRCICTLQACTRASALRVPPDDLHKVTPAAAEHEQVARIRGLGQQLLRLCSQCVEAVPDIRRVPQRIARAPPGCEGNLLALAADCAGA